MIVNRLFRAELGLEGDGRTLTGYAVPYGVEATVDDGDGPYVESFKRGAFKQVIKAPHVVKLMYEHTDNPERWIGSGRPQWREAPEGLHTVWRLDDPNAPGREVVATLAYKIRDGQLPAMSVSFVPGRNEEFMRDGLRHVVRASVKMIDHVALVPEGAYPMLAPLALRDARARASSVEAWAEWRKQYLDRVKR